MGCGSRMEPTTAAELSNELSNGTMDIHGHHWNNPNGHHVEIESLTHRIMIWMESIGILLKWLPPTLIASSLNPWFVDAAKKYTLEATTCKYINYINQIIPNTIKYIEMLYQKLHTSPFHPILPFLPCLRPTAVALAPLSSLRARSGHDLGEVAARQQGTAVPMLQPTEDLPRKPQPTASDVMSQGQFGEQVGPWSSMVIHPWSSMVIHGHPWSSKLQGPQLLGMNASVAALGSFGTKFQLSRLTWHINISLNVHEDSKFNPVQCSLGVQHKVLLQQAVSRKSPGYISNFSRSRTAQNWLQLKQQSWNWGRATNWCCCYSSRSSSSPRRPKFAGNWSADVEIDLSLLSFGSFPASQTSSARLRKAGFIDSGNREFQFQHRQSTTVRLLGFWSLKLLESHQHSPKISREKFPTTSWRLERTQTRRQSLEPWEVAKLCNWNLPRLPRHGTWGL